jgi:hypothetical protein
MGAPDYEEGPDNPEDWALLRRAYQVLGAHLREDTGSRLPSRSLLDSLTGGNDCKGSVK